jgi:hypothetical protein
MRKKTEALGPIFWVWLGMNLGQHTQLSGRQSQACRSCTQGEAACDAGKLSCEIKPSGFFVAVFRRLAALEPCAHFQTIDALEKQGPLLQKAARTWT